MNLPNYEERQAVEMYEMVTRLIALAGMTDATAQVCKWLTESATRHPEPERRQLLAMVGILQNEDFLSRMMSDQAIVVCRGDRVEGELGPYELATRRVFTREEAAEYAKGVSPSRSPIVVTGSFDELRKA